VPTNNNKQINIMEAINKLRAMHNWYDMQCEHMNFEFKSLKGMEKAFDYAANNNLSFIDNDYLYNEIENNEEREKHILNIKKFQNI
jgi:hypothetical protein